MNRINLTKAQKVALISVVIVAVFYAYFHFVYDPANRNLEQLNVQIDQTRQELTRLGDPPDLDEVRKQLEAASENLDSVRSEFEYMEMTRKANLQPTVTKAMALINQLAVKNQLDVKHLVFMERVLETGAQVESAQDEGRTGTRRRARRGQREEEVITAADHFQWDRYNIVLTGTQSGMVNFMGDLSQAFWLVLINELEISLSEAAMDEEQDHDPQQEPEFELALEIML